MKADGALAKAVAAAMKRRDKRAWTLVQFAAADWTHGYCTGERAGAWRFAAGKLKKVKPPAILEVPYAQFSVKEKRVLVESSTKNASGQGEVFEARKARGALELVETPDGVRWRVGS